MTSLTIPVPATKVKPLCPVFGICGGCAYQDIPYEKELAVKEAGLKEILILGLGIGEDIFKPIVPSPEPYFYRSRLDLTLRRKKDGFLMGFQPSSSHYVLDIESCSIARREISGFLPELKKMAVARLPENYENANLVVKTSADGKIRWGGIGRRSLVLKPEDYLWTEIHGKRIFYSLETFFQANLSILPRVMEEIQKLVSFDRETFFFDLYAGVGLFGIYFSGAAGKIAMMEEECGSVALMRYNAAYHGLEESSIHAGKVEALLPPLIESAGPMRTVAMVDPPRRGLSPEALAMLTGAKKIDELLYLSCHPESLLRDLKVFTGAGWRIEKIVPFDFFPKTAHLETLVLLRCQAPRCLAPFGGIDLAGLFGNSNPVEIEIGCGKGKFLMARASECPGINFLGIDRVEKWMKIAREKSFKRKIENLKFIKDDARLILERLRPGTIAAFHIYFPDPWPKRRHRKRRLVTDGLLRLLHTGLVPDGLIEIATDDPDYFAEIKKAAVKTEIPWKQIRETINQRMNFPSFKTNYELKYESAGKNLYYLELVK